MKEKILTITKKDCRMDTFYAGGPGGQNQNKRKTGVRFTHLPSGATGESREHRTQGENKQAAWKRLGEHPKLKLWIYKELLTLDDIDDRVKEALQKIKLEIRQDGSWVQVDKDYFQE